MNVSINQLVELTGHTSRTIKRRLDGLLPLADKGPRKNAVMYDSRQALTLIYAQVSAPPAGPGEAEQRKHSLEEARTRLADEQADAQEIKNAVRRGELIEAGAVEHALASVGVQLVAVLDSISPNIKRLVPSLTARHIKLIKTEIIKAQNAASRIKVEEN